MVKQWMLCPHYQVAQERSFFIWHFANQAASSLFPAEVLLWPPPTAATAAAAAAALSLGFSVSLSVGSFLSVKEAGDGP